MKQGRENGKGSKTKTSRKKGHLYFPLLHRFLPDLLVVGADLEAEQEKRRLMMRIERPSMFVLMSDRLSVFNVILGEHQTAKVLTLLHNFTASQFIWMNQNQFI